MQDIYGQTVTLSSGAALAAWNATQRAFLAHAAVTPKHLSETLEADPDFALAHAVKGMFMLLLGRRELLPEAKTALQAARRSAQVRPLTARETGYVDALDAWESGQLTIAIALLETVLDAAPADTLAMKLSHALRFVVGDVVGMRGSVERVLPAHAEGHPGRGYALGCHAFALEETGDYMAARRAALAGLALAEDDAWGLHAVAHVFDMTGDSRAGIDWLTGREAAWAHCNNFRYHVWWHKALMHLDQGETDVVLTLYDTEIRADRTDDYRDISNATSLLSRLELEGVDVAHRWEELAALSEERTEDGCLIFADLHYLLALIGGDRAEARTRLIGRIASDARSAHDDRTVRMARPGLAAAQGLEAFGEGNYASAFQYLAAARRAMQLAGGSHAQRDVFERLTIDAGIRAGRIDDAEVLLMDRTRRRAGREDRYAAARHGLISAVRGASGHDGARIPAE